MSNQSKNPGAFSLIADFDGDINTLYNTPYDDILPVLALRNLMLFPGVVIPVTVGRVSSLALIEEALSKKSVIAVACQRKVEIDEPLLSDLYTTGVAAKVMRVIDMPNGQKTVILQGAGRLKIGQLTRKKPYLRAHVERLNDVLPQEDDREYEAIVDACKETAMEYVRSIEDIPDEAIFALQNMTHPIYIINYICTNMPFDLKDKWDLMEEEDQKVRSIKLLSLLKRFLDFARLKQKIQLRTQQNLDKQQKDYFLQQQIKSIQDELGESDNEDVVELKKKAASVNFPAKAKELFLKELKKLERLPQNSPDYSVCYNYLITVLSLPWGKVTTDNLNISNAERILNRDHYGLENVKERILEYLAVLSFQKDMKAPIICLVGPPGVGKTSLGHSIAEALNRKYVRISLGGVHDEAEIRGHRKTYIGAMPGRIIKGLQKAGTDNPVFILDEIDKVSNSNINGDPQSALLEVLDPEQNSAYHDNFLDLDYNLSNILFIATANSLQSIPTPLLDRMEIIRVEGYLTEEKKEIAKRHLIPNLNKQLKFVEPLRFSNPSLEFIIENYTRESGVRQLEKQLEKVFRKTAFLMVKNEENQPEAIKVGNIQKMLGKPLFSRDKYQGNNFAGVVTGLAWTSVGGEILFIETSVCASKSPKLTITGNLGDVMKESAILALEYIKSHAVRLNVESDFFESHSVHIHVPEGATPKDGPSAGITIATSIASAITKRKVKANLAMTGEITLRGRVLPVGGIKEKILAAKRAGISHIIMSEENKKDIEEIKDCYIKGLTFHFVKSAFEVLEIALLEEKVNTLD